MILLLTLSKEKEYLLEGDDNSQILSMPIWEYIHLKIVGLFSWKGLKLHC